MKEWNERRLDDFFRMNFNSTSCKRVIEKQTMTVTDENNDSITFVIRDNRIYSQDTGKFYQG